MKLSQFKFSLPKNLIGKFPKIPRDSCKLMVLDSHNQTLETHRFRNVIDYIEPGEVLVLNDSKVFPAKLYGTKEKTKAKIEVFLLRQLSTEENIWDVVVDPARKVRIGNRIFFSKNISCEVIDNTTSRGRIIRFNMKEDFKRYVEKHGKMPIPYYIKRDATDKDKEYYQTIYAKNEGSVSVPAAGIHFTKDLFKKIRKKGVKIAFVTLHIGLGTYRLVEVEDLSKHRMDSECYEITRENAELINSCIDRRKAVIAVGTSTVRALESSVITGKHVRPGKGWTDRFIHPPQSMNIVKKLITNFQMPQSTHLMLSCTLTDRDLLMKAYKKAIKEKYKFLCYGDAMIII